MQHYHKALELTHSMLDAAQKSEWEKMVVLEKERAALIDQLRLEDVDPNRDIGVRDRKRELIRDIVQCDEQIQILTRDWMRELREVLGSIRTEQKLSRTYEG